MDISLLRDRLHQLKSFFESTAGLQKNGSLTKTNPEVIQLARGIALILIAVFLGWICKTETETSNRRKVLTEEWPSTQIWQATLKQGGWTQLTGGDWSGLLKNHPDPYRDESVIWESDDHCLIFITKSPFSNDNSNPAGPELWSCATSQKSSNPKTKWHKIGSGYEGLNQLSRIPVRAVKKAPSYIDPKEIRY